MLQLILVFFVLMLILGLGGWAIEGIIKHYLKQADDRVKRFEEQLKDERNGKV